MESIKNSPEDLAMIHSIADGVQLDHTDLENFVDFVQERITYTSLHSLMFLMYPNQSLGVLFEMYITENKEENTPIDDTVVEKLREIVLGGNHSLFH